MITAAIFQWFFWAELHSPIRTLLRILCGRQLLAWRCCYYRAERGGRGLGRGVETGGGAPHHSGQVALCYVL